MARNCTAYMQRGQIPARTALQAAIKALGFKLKLEEEFDPSAASTYLPCTLDGEDAGFTLRIDDSAEIPGKDAALTLQWSGDPRERVAVLMVAAALAHDFAAVVHDQEQALKNAEELLAEAEQEFSDLG